MIKKLLLTIALLAVPMLAQTPSVSGTLTASGSTCGIPDPTGACVTLPIYSATGAVTVTLAGTFSATVQFEALGADGATWVAINSFPLNSTTAVTSATSTGVWWMNAAGTIAVRARASAYVSGTVNVAIHASTASRPGSGGGGAGGGVTAVTGVAPIASTGGTTPAISLQNATPANVTSAIGTDTAIVTASGTFTSGNAVSGDANGGIHDSGTSVASLAAPAFSAITTGTNATTLTMGTGGTLTTSGTGVINANQLNFGGTVQALGTAPTSNQFLTYNGTNITGAAVSLVFPVTVSGTVNSGGIPCFTSTTNMASSATYTAGSVITGGGSGACATGSTFSVSGGNFGLQTQTSNVIFGKTGGSTTATAGGTATYTAAGNSSNATSGIVTGATSLTGADNTDTGAVETAGSVIIIPGHATAASTAATANQGLLQIKQVFRSSGTPTISDMACFLGAGVVGNCSGTSAVATVGVITATNATTVATVEVQGWGTASVNSSASGTWTAGDFVCEDTTNGVQFAKDNGTTACPVGTKIGVAYGDSGAGTSHTIVIMVSN